MSKIKMAVRTPRIDMTPMVDLFFLLLTFFMLTTTFRPQEAVQVDTPNSVSEELAPDKDVMTIEISKDNKVFFNIDNGSDTAWHIRKKVLMEVAKYKQVEFTKEQLNMFEKLNSFGMPLANLGEWIDAESKDRDQYQVGIPMDSVNNELALWIHFSRLANPRADATIKGDSESDYTTIKKVIDILQDKKINRFNLTTNLEKVEIKPEDLKF
jgi:biopolymer transport protein ExbD